LVIARGEKREKRSENHKEKIIAYVFLFATGIYKFRMALPMGIVTNY
jgi:hypothetical protein